MKTSVFSLDAQTLKRMERKFEEKRKLSLNRDKELFGVFEQNLSDEELCALKFLYAYMPLNDLADYDGPLFLSHVRTTLEIRERMPWGKRVPDHLFLHFVLPYRVNNENIEDCRVILAGELADRVAQLSMADAILETNHWCYEKATYVGNDPRTVSPLTLMRTTLGRCGEQSTLAVSALRSLCIPARQCYTPRWAHCDSNHAWVEAWADGKWHFIGACEPEPRLNQGWFSAPARRAMLVNTRVPSNYPGPEDITLAHEWYTEINLLDGYAPHRTITVRVKDTGGMPAGGAKVWFNVYNFAEFTPIAKLTANERGEVSFKTGYGDLLLHASDGIRWSEKKIGAADGAEYEVVLNRLEQPEGVRDIEMIPPPELPDNDGASVTELEKQAHNIRIQEGARIRKSFEDTFINEEQASRLADEWELPAERVWNVLRKARGNSHEIAAFLREQTPEYGQWPLRLLESLNNKDLTDTFRSTLCDHLTGSLKVKGSFDDETFAQYILCPRVLYEMIGPYKQFFQALFSEAEAEQFRREPAKAIARLEQEFEVVEDMTYYQGSATPAGSFRLRKGDASSRDIMFVALCRSLGIPARLHPSERKPQYWAAGAWKDAAFAAASNQPAEAKEFGRVRLLHDQNGERATDTESGDTAAYFRNFSFARLEHGFYKTLFYPHGKTDVYDEAFELLPGSYRMTAGTRLKDGSVLVRFTYFTLHSGDCIEVPLTFRRESIDIPVLGQADRESLFLFPDGKGKALTELAGPQGAIVAWIEPDREPSKHLLREIGELAEGFEKLGIPIVFAVGDEGWTASFDPAAYRGLPSGAGFLRDASYAALESMKRQAPTVRGGFPLVYALDGQGRIRYGSAGYKLGIGREALQVLTRLPEKS